MARPQPVVKVRVWVDGKPVEVDLPGPLSTLRPKPTKQPRRGK